MNGVSENLLSAIDIVVNNAVSNLKYDKTIQGEIYSIEDLDTGEYKVRYLTNIFSAFAADLNKQYKIGDNVYVTVPEGDFSNKKVINSKITSSSLSYGQMTTLANSIVEKSPTIDTMYSFPAPDPNTGAIAGVVAGAPEGSPLSYETIYKASTGKNHELFRQYARVNNLIRIKASFKTLFHGEHTKGNYGLRVVFYAQGGQTVEYTLDLNSFNGDPYSLSVYSPQSIIVQAQPGFLMGLESITLFEENFNYDVHTYIINKETIIKENTTTPNIFVTDLEIGFVEQKDLTQNPYYLYIAAPLGSVFTATQSSLDLVAKLIHEGENIMSDSKCVCKWYKQDLAVTTGHNSYEKIPGVGWIPIAATSETVTIQRRDVPYIQAYKLVVTYNESVVLTDEITLTNMVSEYDFGLRQMTVGDDIELAIINNKTSSSLVGDWYLQYPDSSYRKISNSPVNAIKVKQWLLYSSAKFFCGVYSEDGSKIVGILEHTITRSDSDSDVTITYIGESQFRYDANGDITIEDSEKERLLEVELAWKDGVGISYTVEWLAPDGHQLQVSSGTGNEVRYKPSQSMIREIWLDEYNILHYNIQQKYKVNYTNNTFTVRIITIDGSEYEFKKEILFLKDGDQGTNGTTYVVAIRPVDSTYPLVKLPGLQPLVYRNGTWISGLMLRCFVYKDGEAINDDSALAQQYSIKYRWEGINVTMNNDSSINVIDNSTSDSVYITGRDIITAGSAPYVKVQAKINDRMGDEYSIYAFYPIDVSVNFETDEVMKINIDNIPSYIKYSSSGLNPSFYSNSINFIYDGTDMTNKISSMNTAILAIQDRDTERYLKPASSFIFEDNTIAMIKCEYTTDKYLYHPIMMYLDAYGNEDINGWDGTSIPTGDGGYILAPQIGAGIKDSQNRFTGVVMGKDTGQQKIGLYGYQQGLNTFGLTEDGNAYFGVSGRGRIDINGTNATISGGGGGNSTNGMTITLANYADANNDAIRIGGTKFVVKYNGDATVEGTITANGGKIGGWHIDGDVLWCSRGTNRVELNADSTSDDAIIVGSKFSVTKAGIITAKEGYIGGWQLLNNELTSNNRKTGMASGGTFAFWAGKVPVSGDTSETTRFSVTHNGELSCYGANITGTITAKEGYIGGWHIDGDRITSKDYGGYGSTILNSNGQITCRWLQADTGYIGGAYGTGWSISSGQIASTNGQTILYSNGNITCNGGTLTANKVDLTGTITAKEGYIGKWEIDTQGNISNGNTTLTYDGDIHTKEIYIYDGSTPIGKVGYTQSANTGDTIFGITGYRSVVIDAGINDARIRAATFWMQVDKEAQHGIYARFA